MPLHAQLEPEATRVSYHTIRIAADASDLLFPSETSTTLRIGNDLKRVLKPLAEKAGIKDITYQALRRTCATHVQRHGGSKDAQAQLIHSKLEMTGHYVQQIPGHVRAAVEKMDTEICAGTDQTVSAVQ